MRARLPTVRLLMLCVSCAGLSSLTGLMGSPCATGLGSLTGSVSGHKILESLQTSNGHCFNLRCTGTVNEPLYAAKFFGCLLIDIAGELRTLIMLSADQAEEADLSLAQHAPRELHEPEYYRDRPQFFFWANVSCGDALSLTGASQSQWQRLIESPTAHIQDGSFPFQR